MEGFRPVSTSQASQAETSAGATAAGSRSARGPNAATVTTGFLFLPGLSQTVSVPSDAVVYVSADGGVQTTSATSTGFSEVDVIITVDASLPANGGYKRVIAANTTGRVNMITNFDMAEAMPLTTGTHTIAVAARLNAGSPANVSGDSTSVLQGELTVTILKK